MKLSSLPTPDFCGVEATIAIIGGRWKANILSHLIEGTHRFGELRRKGRGVSQRMLTQQLREMELHGLITRKIFPEVPPRVEYTITPLGRSLRPVLNAMYEWGMKNRKVIEGRLRTAATD
jgi:DNA-binding HxlR family transcriptional regulator